MIFFLSINSAIEGNCPFNISFNFPKDVFSGIVSVISPLPTLPFSMAKNLTVILIVSINKGFPFYLAIDTLPQFACCLYCAIFINIKFSAIGVLRCLCYYIFCNQIIQFFRRLFKSVLINRCCPLQKEYCLQRIQTSFVLLTDVFVICPLYHLL